MSNISRPKKKHQIFSDPPRLVIRKVQKEDQGMYQCFVTNEWEQIQSTAELQLGGKLRQKPIHQTCLLSFMVFFPTILNDKLQNRVNSIYSFIYQMRRQNCCIGFRNKPFNQDRLFRLNVLQRQIHRHNSHGL